MALVRPQRQHLRLNRFLAVECTQRRVECVRIGVGSGASFHALLRGRPSDDPCCYGLG